MRDWGTYRKLYETLPPAFERLPYSARCFAAEIIRRCDAKGRIVPGTILSETLLKDLLFHVRAHTDDEQFMRRALGELLADGYLVFRDGYLVVRNFVAAQRKDSTGRMQEKRARDSADGMTDEGADDQGRTEPEPPGEPRCDARDAGDAHAVTPSSDLRAPHLISSHLISDPERSRANTGNKPINGRARADVPAPIPENWQPDAEQAAALAEKWGVTVKRIMAEVAEFRWYWLRGPGAGKRKSLRGWAQTFGNRIEFLAKKESLYAGPGATPANNTTPTDESARKAKAAEVEARARGAK